MKPDDDIIENLSMVAPPDQRWLIFVALAVLVLAALAWGLWHLTRTGKISLFQKPVIPPETLALEKLAAIRPLIAEGRVRDFVEQISDILRTYLEARFGLLAPRLSTEEFLYEARKTDSLGVAQRAGLGEFLFCCDSVKFALGGLGVAAMEELYQTAERFIIQSTPAKAEPSTAPALRS